MRYIKDIEEAVDSLEMAFDDMMDSLPSGQSHIPQKTADNIVELLSLAIDGLWLERTMYDFDSEILKSIFIASNSEVSEEMSVKECNERKKMENFRSRRDKWLITIEATPGENTLRIKP